MSGSAVIGALRVVFDADNDNFNEALDQSRGKIGLLEHALSDLTDKMRDAGVKIAAVGAGFTAALTVPLAALSKSAVQTGGDFEAAMKRVESALDSVTGEQLKALEAQARTMGPTVGRGATEAASAIESLAKNGLDASNILGGALAAALKLAAAGQADLASASDLTTDIMHQFGKSAADLSPVVDKVSGALLASKFGFQDYQLAVGQAGGVAGAVGVSFEDFNTALAGTSSLFQSGSDAGTSFKTFLTNLTGNSKQAKKEMTDLGISFYDSTHHLKSMADVAEVLRTTLGGLSEEARSKVLTDIFGTDGMRTAIGLMKLGKQGFIDLQDTIGKASADKQVAKGQEGYVAAMARLAAAFENLKISIAQSGLLDLFTAFANAMTRLVNGMASLSPFFMKIAAGFAAVGAALGPLLIVLGGALYLAVGFFLRTLGPLGWAISAVVEPIGTLVAALRVLVVRFGFRAILTGLADAFLGLAGPIGWAIAAFIMFSDYVIPVLEQFWNRATATLGPPLVAIFDKLQQTFAKIGNGPIGAVFMALIQVVGVLFDVVGVGLAAALQEAGTLIIMLLGVITATFGTIVNVISDAIDLIDAVLNGDFAGAWKAAGQIVSDVFDGIVNAMVALVPDMEMQLRIVGMAVKAWLSDAFTAAANWVGKAVEAMVAVVVALFPNVVSAAAGVYAGVKGWLVDKFSGVLEWIGGAVKWIGDKWGELKASLGLGITVPIKADTGPTWLDKLKAAFKMPTIPKNDYMPSSDGAAGKRTPKGRDTKFDQTNRDELEIQAQLEAARLRNDQETVRALETKLALQKQIEAYQRTGLSLAEATAAATRDEKLIAEARAQQTAKQIEDDHRSFEIKLAEIAGNGQLVESLKSQEYLQQRIEFWRKEGLSTVAATAAATADQLRLDTAVAEQRERATKAAEADRKIALAKARGDTDAQIRAMEQARDIERRSGDLQKGTEGRAPMSKDEADAQAASEVLQMEQARQMGIWRDTIRGGFRAALDGNLGDWFKNWWKDRVAKGMEEALNRISDLVFKLFSSIGSNSGGGGGGLGGLLTSIGSAIFGGGGGGAGAGAGAFDFGSIFSGGMQSIGFATGGSFEVGGRSGIDQNLVSFRASKGEMVNITRPGNDNGATGGGGSIVMHNDFRGADAAAVPRIEAKLDELNRSLEGRSVAAVADAMDRRIIRRGM